jgi:hypothetical protein
MFKNLVLLQHFLRSQTNVLFECFCALNWRKRMKMPFFNLNRLLSQAVLYGTNLTEESQNISFPTI